MWNRVSVGVVESRVTSSCLEADIGGARDRYAGSQEQAQQVQKKQKSWFALVFGFESGL